MDRVAGGASMREEPAVPDTPLPGAEAARRPVVGLLWGDFPWSAPPRTFGKLLS